MRDDVGMIRLGWWTRRLGLCLAFCVVAMATLPAVAQDKATAKAAYRRGLQHYNLDEIEQALVAFREAYRAFEDPIFLFNIGQCQRRLGQHQAAISSFRAYLREVRDAPNRAEVEKFIEKLAIEIEREQKLKEANAAAEAARVAEQKRAEAAAAEAARLRAASTATTGKTTSEAVVASAPSKPPLHKRWWLWATVGGGVVVGLAVGLGLGLGLPPRDTFQKLDGSNQGVFRF